jgi:hypothetical protein
MSSAAEKLINDWIDDAPGMDQNTPIPPARKVDHPDGSSHTYTAKRLTEAEETQFSLLRWRTEREHGTCEDCGRHGVMYEGRTAPPENHTWLVLCAPCLLDRSHGYRTEVTFQKKPEYVALYDSVSNDVRVVIEDGVLIHVAKQAKNPSEGRCK